MAISGNATTAEGLPVDLVRVFSWPGGALARTVIPDENGNWGFEPKKPGEFGVTYIAAGCQPITHGPYLSEAWSPLEIFEPSDNGAVYLPWSEQVFAGTTGTTPAFKGEAIGRMADYTGNGYDMTQSTVSYRPRYFEELGKEVALLSGDFMEAPLRIPAPVTIAVGMKLNTGSGFMYGFGAGYIAGASGYGIGRGDSGKYVIQARIEGEIQGMTSTVSAGAPIFAVLSVDATGHVSFWDQNGKQTADSGLANIVPNTNLAIGRHSLYSPSVGDFDGEFYGGMIINRTVTDDEAVQLMDFFANIAQA